MRLALPALVLLSCLLGCARRYRVEGLVVDVRPAERTVTVSHRPIPGFMPAMTMPFRVAHTEEIDKLHPGARVRFQLRLRHGQAEARDIRVEPREAFEGFTVAVPVEKLAPGDLAPDFELTDHSGRLRRLSEFSGRLAAINFLYTRCPLPEVCPRLAASFAALQRRFAGRIPKDLVLLSLTLDPLHDTPEVLARYAARVGAQPEGWLFLTGTSEQIQAVARRFGLVHWAEEGAIVHTSATAVIGRDRRLLGLIEGASFRPEQLADLVAHHLTKEPETR